MKTIKECLEKGGIYAIIAHLWMIYSWPKNPLCEHKPSNYLYEIERHNGQLHTFVAAQNAIFGILFNVFVSISIFGCVAAMWENSHGDFPGYMFYVQNGLGVMLCLLIAGWLSKLGFDVSIDREKKQHQKTMSEYNVDEQFDKDFSELELQLSLPKFSFQADQSALEEMASRLIKMTLARACFEIIGETEQAKIDDLKGYCIYETHEFLTCYQRFGILKGRKAADMVELQISAARAFKEKQITGK